MTFDGVCAGSGDAQCQIDSFESIMIFIIHLMHDYAFC